MLLNEEPSQMQYGNQLSGWKDKATPPMKGPDHHHCIELPALCKSKKYSGTDSVNAQADRAAEEEARIQSSDCQQSRCHPVSVSFQLNPRKISSF
jgi:hypothetical protein